MSEMSSARWVRAGTTIAVIVGLGILVAWLRATAPAPRVDPSFDPALLSEDVVTCEEIITDVGEAGAGPIGRVISTEVLTCPFQFDGLQVRYIGEVVGDVLGRDGGSWTLMNDDPYALGDGPLTAGGTPRGTNSGLAVWLPEPLDDLADEPGRPGRRGDVLVVTGTVHRADPADGGGLTIRADEAEVLAAAVDIDEPIHWRQVGAAAVLGVLALLVLWRERQRRLS